MYIDNKEAAGKEMRQSSYLLIVIGFVGTVFSILDGFGIINAIPDSFTSPAFYIIMGIFFVFVFVTGIMSIKSSKKMIEKGKDESKLTEEILEWFYANYDADKINGSLSADENPEELFFIRNERICYIIHDKYPNATESYVQYLSERIYNKFYE